METNPDYNTYSKALEWIPCKDCGKQFKLEAGRIPVCDACREAYIHYPIPGKIIALISITLCIVIVIMISRFPVSLEAGVCYEKAVLAMEEKRFVDAENLLEQAYGLIPNSLTIIGNLAICCHTNLHHDRELELLDEMYVKQMEFHDDALFQKVSDINNEIGVIFNLPEEFIENYEKLIFNLAILQDMWYMKVHKRRIKIC